MLRLSDQLYGTIVGETPILFDVAKGRYLSLRGLAAENFRALYNSGLATCEVDQLVGAGVVDDPNAVAFEPDPPIAAESYEDRERHPPSFSLTFRAFHAQVLAKREVSRHRLPGILKILNERRATQPWTVRSPAGVTEADVSAAFVRTRLLLPSLDQCVARSVAIVSILGRYGYDATLIIGVQLPFAAHCWVQCEDRVVGDSLDRTRAFKPIFAL